MNRHLKDCRGPGTRRWISLAAIFASVIAAGPLARAGEPAEPLSPITVSEAWPAVVDELRSRGFREEQLPPVEALDLPVAVPAHAGRKLRVSSVCWDANDGRARFRLQCSEAGACLPFLVYVRVAENARAVSCDLGRQSRSPSLTQIRASAPMLRAGDRATAVLVAAGLRMTAAVTCLDRGARGDVIRVRGPEGYIFRARVTGPALVETLP